VINWTIRKLDNMVKLFFALVGAIGSELCVTIDASDCVSDVI
jgi:hypothetical protein